jgi:branched-chain amino acid transport system permease protein
MPNLVVGKVIFPGLRMALLAGTVLLTVGLDLFLRRTFLGRAIVASSINRIGAVVVGIDTQFVAIATFALGIALAAGTGVFYAALYSVEPFMGLSLTLKYLAVIIVGGMGSLSGAMLGGFVIAAAETYTSYFLGSQWAPMVAFIILIVALLIRPQGLVGRS